MRIDVERAAALLHEIRQTGLTIPELPDGLRPGTVAEAYAIQDALHELLGTDLAVLKVGGTSAAAQETLAVSEPIGGRIDREQVFRSGAVVPLARFHHPPLLECEFGLRLAVTDGEGTADAVVPAIELVDSRYDGLLGASGPSLVADNSVAAAVVLGEPVAIDSVDLAAVAVELSSGGASLATGTAEAVTGGPFRSLAWALAHERTAGRDVPLGTVVITGTCTGLTPAPLDQPIVARFEGVGQVEVTLSS